MARAHVSRTRPGCSRQFLRTLEGSEIALGCATDLMGLADDQVRSFVDGVTC